MFYTDTNTCDAVMEAYYGKPKEFLIIEKELDKVIKMIKNEKSNINTSDSVNTIEKIFKKFFKLEDFYLCFYTSIPIIRFINGVMVNDTPLSPYNAFTFTKGFNYFRTKVSKNRVDSTGLVIGVNVSTDIIKYTDITSGELMAIILHEIGHNMEASLFSFIGNVSKSAEVIVGNNKEASIMQIIFSSIVGVTINDLVVSNFFTRSNKIIQEFIDSAPFIKKLFESISLFWNTYVRLIGLMPTKILAGFKNIVNPKFYIDAVMPSNLFGFTSEKYADSFATAYGYGVELSKGLNSIDQGNKIPIISTIKDIPVLNWSYDLITVSYSIIYGLVDPHPKTAARIQAQLTKLKREIKDPNLDNRVKKDLEANIKDLEKFINEQYLDFESNNNKSKVFSWIYNNTVIKIFNGKVDPRELLTIFNVEE